MASIILKAKNISIEDVYKKYGGPINPSSNFQSKQGMAAKEVFGGNPNTGKMVLHSNLPLNFPIDPYSGDEKNTQVYRAFELFGHPIGINSDTRIPIFNVLGQDIFTNKEKNTQVYRAFELFGHPIGINSDTRIPIFNVLRQDIFTNNEKNTQAFRAFQLFGRPTGINTDTRISIFNVLGQDIFTNKEKNTQVYRAFELFGHPIGINSDTRIPIFNVLGQDIFTNKEKNTQVYRAFELFGPSIGINTDTRIPIFNVLGQDIFTNNEKNSQVYRAFELFGPSIGINTDTRIPIFNVLRQDIFTNNEKNTQQLAFEQEGGPIAPGTFNPFTIFGVNVGAIAGTITQVNAISSTLGLNIPGGNTTNTIALNAQFAKFVPELGLTDVTMYARNILPNIAKKWLFKQGASNTLERVVAAGTAGLQALGVMNIPEPTPIPLTAGTFQQKVMLNPIIKFTDNDKNVSGLDHPPKENSGGISVTSILANQSTILAIPSTGQEKGPYSPLIISPFNAKSNITAQKEKKGNLESLAIRYADIGAKTPLELDKLNKTDQRFHYIISTPSEVSSSFANTKINYKAASTTPNEDGTNIAFPLSNRNAEMKSQEFFKNQDFVKVAIELLLWNDREINSQIPENSKVDDIPNYGNKWHKLPCPMMGKVANNDVYENAVFFWGALDGLTEAISPSYDSVQYIGRTVPVYRYTNTNRTINFNLKLVSMRPEDHEAMMRRIDFLTKLCYPGPLISTIGIGRQIPLLRITIGDLYYRQHAILTSLNKTWNTDMWVNLDNLKANYGTIKTVTGTEVDMNIPDLSNNNGGVYPIMMEAGLSFTILYESQPTYNTTFENAIKDEFKN